MRDTHSGTNALLWGKMGLLWDSLKDLKVIIVSWVSGSKQVWIRSFKWGTKHWFWSKNYQLSLIRHWCPGVGWTGRFFSTSKFDLSYFYSFLICKSIQYLIEKSDSYRFGTRSMAWLLIHIMLAQSIPISYNKEACVGILFKKNLNFVEIIKVEWKYH